MSARDVRRYVDDLLRDRRPKGFRPDDEEAAQLRTAIELRAAGDDAGLPRAEFVEDLQRRIAAHLDDDDRADPVPGRLASTRRQVIVGTSAAAVAAVAAVSLDRATMREPRNGDGDRELTPAAGSWQRVADSAAVTDETMHPFDLGSVVGFVRRVDGRLEAVSGVCTHQGCRLWFDAGDDRLRCPCHSTSFSPEGLVLTHQLPIAPKPLPTLDVRDNDGHVEVFAPPKPDETA